MSKGIDRSVQSIQSGDPFDLREAIDWLGLLSHQYSGLFITTHLETFYTGQSSAGEAICIKELDRLRGELIFSCLFYQFEFQVLPLGGHNLGPGGYFAQAVALALGHIRTQIYTCELVPR